MVKKTKKKKKQRERDQIYTDVNLPFIYDFVEECRKCVWLGFGWAQIVVCVCVCVPCVVGWKVK